MTEKLSNALDSVASAVQESNPTTALTQEKVAALLEEGRQGREELEKEQRMRNLRYRDPMWWMETQIEKLTSEITELRKRVSELEAMKEQK